MRELINAVAAQQPVIIACHNAELIGRLAIELGDIPGIGPQRQRVLLRRFGSVKGLRQATRDEIARIPGFSEALASRVLTYLGR